RAAAVIRNEPAATQFAAGSLLETDRPDSQTMSISSLGIGSGLDLANLVDQLVAAERAPAQSRITLKQTHAQTKLSALGSLRSAISNLETALAAIKSFKAGMKATSVSPEAVSATAGGAPVAGVYNVVVRELASAQSL